MLSQDDLKKLCEPFAKDSVGVKIQSFSKDRTKALLVLYLQHTDVYGRLEQVDPGWSCRVTHTETVEKTVYVTMQMTVKDVTRENVGEGDDHKSAYSDALKRSAMLFGVGRYLYDSEQVWVPYNESTDRFKGYTMDDYNRGLRPNQARTPEGPVQRPAGSSGTSPKLITQAQRNRLFAILGQSDWKDADLRTFIKNRFGLESTKDLNMQQYDQVVRAIESGSPPKPGDFGYEPPAA